MSDAPPCLICQLFLTIDQLETTIRNHTLIPKYGPPKWIQDKLNRIFEEVDDDE